MYDSWTFLKIKNLYNFETIISEMDQYGIDFLWWEYQKVIPNWIFKPEVGQIQPEMGRRKKSHRLKKCPCCIGKSDKSKTGDWHRYAALLANSATSGCRDRLARITCGQGWESHLRQYWKKTNMEFPLRFIPVFAFTNWYFLDFSSRLKNSQHSSLISKAWPSFGDQKWPQLTSYDLTLKWSQITKNF